MLRQHATTKRAASAWFATCLLVMRFAAGLLEGMSRIEAEAYHLLAKLGASPVQRVLTAGGGAVNDKWTAMRAAALGVPVAAAAQGAGACQICSHGA